MLLLLAALLVLFIIAVAAGLNGSSVGEWNTAVPQPGMERDGLLLGAPRAIRSDEWMGLTPWAMSQQQLQFPAANADIGAHTDALLENLPVQNIAAPLRPQNWGYFPLGIERGFSFYWSFKVFGLLASAFLLLMLLGGNRFWLALVGSVWLFFSSYTQWWFSANVPELLTAGFTAFIALAYLLLSRRLALMAGAWVVFALSAPNFIFFFYPAFQVPLVYLFLFLMAGMLLAGGRWRQVRERLLPRLLLLGSAAVFIGAVLLVYYNDASSTVQAITSTVYPGRRASTGGDIGLARMFGGLTGFPHADEQGFPAIWENVSEASNFILLFPVIVIAAVWNRIRGVKNAPLVTALCAYLVLLTGWIVVGAPPVLARLTLLAYVPSRRALLAAGAGSIILTIVFLAYQGPGRRPGTAAADGGEPEPGSLEARPVGWDDDSRPSGMRQPRHGIVFPLAMALATLAVTAGYAIRLKHLAPDFFQYRWLAVMVVAVTAAVWLLLRGSRLLFSLGIIAAILPNLLINPVCQGLGPILDKQAFQAAVDASNKQPGARWLAYGNNMLPNFLTAGGLSVADGIRYTPDLEAFHKLDPARQYEDIYNRYANVSFLEPAADRRNGPASFELIQDDAVIVRLDPCSPALDQLGITNIAFAYQPDESRLRCLVPLGAYPDSHVWLYQRVAGMGARQQAAPGAAG